MNCERTRERLNAYLDGELEPAAEAGVREHLSACQRCAAELEDLRRLNAALDSLERLEVPAGFARRVRRAVSADHGARAAAVPAEALPFRRRLTRVAALLTAAAGIWVGAALGGSLPDGNGSALQAAAAELSAFDLPAEALSAAPAGSVADVYLAFAVEDE